MSISNQKPYPTMSNIIFMSFALVPWKLYIIRMEGLYKMAKRDSHMSIRLTVAQIELAT